MERETWVEPEIIDLGEASEETRGAWGLLSDEILMHMSAGLMED